MGYQSITTAETASHPKPLANPGQDNFPKRGELRIRQLTKFEQFWERRRIQSMRYSKGVGAFGVMVATFCIFKSIVKYDEYRTEKP